MVTLGGNRNVPGQELHQLVSVLEEYVRDWLRLVGISHKHLEHVERLELDVARRIAEQIHHHLKVIPRGDVPRLD